MIGAAKLIQATTVEEDFRQYAGINAQLTFRPRRFDEVNYNDIKKWIASQNVTPMSIHYPSFPGIDSTFVDNLKMLKECFGIMLFTVHPKFETLEECVSSLGKWEREIAELNVTLAYENMPGPLGKWNCYPANIARINLPFVKITLDVTHLPQELDEKEEFDSIAGKIEVIHLSNVRYGTARRDHLPFLEGQRDLVGFLRHIRCRGYKGQVVLEYTPKEAYRLREDIARAKEIMDGS